MTRRRSKLKSRTIAEKQLENEARARDNYRKIIQKKIESGGRLINGGSLNPILRKEVEESPKEIRAKDFVVWGNIHQCRTKNHRLVEVDARIKIVDHNGDKKQQIVPAGYCKSCKVFFLSESVYQELRSRGRLLCRLIDYKIYQKARGNLFGSHLAQESILKQFGYSVSQKDGLSETERHKVLALIVDNDILTRSEVIEYLQFFIQMRLANPEFHLAIEKWRTDQEYIRKYNHGLYQEYEVAGIYRA